MKRKPNKTGPGAYAAFFEAMRSAPRAPTVSSVDIVASTCTGLARLSDRLGVTLHHVDCPGSPARQTEALSLRRYGARVVADGGGFVDEEGWQDWRIVALEHVMVGGCPLAAGVSILAGRLAVALDASISRAAYARRFALMMEPLRFEVALTSGRAIARRHHSGAPLVIAPRYAAGGDDDDWQRAAHLYVFDPWRDLARLAALASAAATELFPLRETDT